MGVVELIRVRFWGLAVHSWSLRSFRYRVHPGCRRVHSRFFGSFGCALGIFWVHYGAPWGP